MAFLLPSFSVESAFADRAHADSALPISCGQTISQPSVVAMMTQVGLTLVLPLPGGANSIECRGAVVRSRPIEAADDGSDRFETAIFFTSMAETDRMALQEFLLTVQEITGD